MGWLRSHLGSLEGKKNLAGDLSENCPYVLQCITVFTSVNKMSIILYRDSVVG